MHICCNVIMSKSCQRTDVCLLSYGKLLYLMIINCVCVCKLDTCITYLLYYSTYLNLTCGYNLYIN